MLTKIVKYNINSNGQSQVYIPKIFAEIIGAEKSGSYKMTLNKDNSITLVLVKGGKDAQ